MTSRLRDDMGTLYANSRTRAVRTASLPDGLRPGRTASGRSCRAVTPCGLSGETGQSRRFLWRLKSVLPEGCHPIVVTDAGFRGPHSQPNDILATGIGALVLHQFVVPTGRAARTPHWLDMSVAPPPVRVPPVFRARLSLWTGPAPQPPDSSREVSTAPPYPVAAATSLPYHRRVAIQIKRIYPHRMQIASRYPRGSLRMNSWGSLRCGAW